MVSAENAAASTLIRGLNKNKVHAAANTLTFVNRLKKRVAANAEVPVPPRWVKKPPTHTGDSNQALPSVAGHISIKRDENGFAYVIEARLRTRVVALLDVDEKESTFKCLLDIALEWEVDESQFQGKEEFWAAFRPVLKFENAVYADSCEETPIFDADSQCENVLMVKQDRNAPDARLPAATNLRHFEYFTRRTQCFRRTFDLERFPFDVQALPIEFRSERSYVFGRPVELTLHHPRANDDFPPVSQSCEESPADAAAKKKRQKKSVWDDPTAEGTHSFACNADGVDDLTTTTIFGLEGEECTPPPAAYPQGAAVLNLVRRNRYVVLIFCTREFRSTIYNIYIPIFFMYILSFLAFFIPPCAIVDRATVLLTIMLTTVSLKSYMSDKLPAVPLMTAVENFLFLITCTFMIQSLFVAGSASFCVKFGALGQFGMDLDVLDSRGDDADGWSCKAGDDAFWCENRRVRMQNVLDVAGIWTSVAVGVVSIFCCIAKAHVSMCRIRFEIVHHKFLSENPCLKEAYERDPLKYWAAHCPVYSYVSRWMPPSATALWVARLIQFWKPSQYAVPYFEDFFARRRGEPAEPAATVGERSQRYAKRKAKAVVFFARKYAERPIAYKNEALSHHFRRPQWENRLLEPSKLNSSVPVEPHRDSHEETVTHRALVFDVGTGDSKCLRASLHAPRDGLPGGALAKLVDKGQPFSLLQQTTPASSKPTYAKRDTRDYFESGADHEAFGEWVEHHVAPVFDFVVDKSSAGEAAADTSQQEAQVQAVFGFEVVPSGKLFVVGVVATAPREAVRHGVVLDADTAVNSINGVPFSFKAARERLARAAECSSFRNPLQHDRVVAMRVLRFAKSRDDRDEQPALLVDQPSQHLETVVVLPGCKGTVVGALCEWRRRGFDDGKVAFSVEWDDSPEFGATLVEQRRYTNKLPSMEGFLVQPINEVRVACLSHAVPDARDSGWIAPIVAIGTGAWYRDSSGAMRRNAERTLERLKRRHPTWRLECNIDLDEAIYEEIAVDYAHRVSQFPAPQAVLGVGNGSTQFSCVPPVDLREKVIVDLSKSLSKSDPSPKQQSASSVSEQAEEERRTVRGFVASRRWHSDHFRYEILLEEALQDSSFTKSEVRARCVERDPASGTQLRLPCMLPCGNKRGATVFQSPHYDRNLSLREQLLERRQKWYDEARGMVEAEFLRSCKISKGTVQSVACISACHYAAVSALLGVNPETVTARQARKAYQTASDELIQAACDAARDAGGVNINTNDGNEQTIDPKKLFTEAAELYRKKDPKLVKDRIGAVTLSNFTYQTVLIDVLFEGDTQMRLCRDWNRDVHPNWRDVKFRTTWSSGWYLSHLSSLGVTGLI